MLPVMEVEYMSYHRRRKAKPRRRFIKESMHKSLREGSSVPPPPFPEKFRHEIELKPSTDPPQKNQTYEIQ